MTAIADGLGLGRSVMLRPPRFVGINAQNSLAPAFAIYD